MPSGYEPVERLARKAPRFKSCQRGTAHKLRMSLLFQLAVAAGHTCFRCGGELTLATFSIEHKEPWLDSCDRVRMFFDLENIAFSHKACNYQAARRPKKKYVNEAERSRVNVRNSYHARSPEENRRRRREKYLQTGRWRESFRASSPTAEAPDLSPGQCKFESCVAHQIRLSAAIRQTSLTQNKRLLGSSPRAAPVKYLTNSCGRAAPLKRWEDGASPSWGTSQWWLKAK